MRRQFLECETLPEFARTGEYARAYAAYEFPGCPIPTGWVAQHTPSREWHAWNNEGRMWVSFGTSRALAYEGMRDASWRLFAARPETLPKPVVEQVLDRLDVLSADEFARVLLRCVRIVGDSDGDAVAVLGGLLEGSDQDTLGLLHAQIEANEDAEAAALLGDNEGVAS